VDDAFPVLLTLRVSVEALLIAGPLGIAIAWLQARRRYPLRTVVDALILLPLVLPPSVVGYFLVMGFGQRGVLGGLLDRAFGVRLVFTPAAAVLASLLVALPLVVKTAQPALEAVPRELEDVGRTLGLPPLSLFFRVSLPMAWRGVVAALALGLARAAGEFGATLMFAGDIPGRTNTMPIEIFDAYRAGEDGRAVVYVAILTALSLVVVMLASRMSRGTAFQSGASEGARARGGGTP
jgi:molybdate transport system permease protein